MKRLGVTGTLRCGVVAGLAGGLVFGAAMLELGMLPTVAGLVRAESALTGFLVHMTVAALIGVGFSLLVRHQHPGAGENLFWGMSYGTFWWFLGPLTLMPLLLGEGVSWQVEHARQDFASLLGHVLYGATVGLAFMFLQRREGRSDAGKTTVGALMRGMAAGVFGAWLLGVALGAQGHPLAIADLRHGEANPLFWSELIVIGIIVGAVFALIYPQPAGRAGPSLVRGTTYGFLLWIVLMLTLVPIVKGTGLAWAHIDARLNFHTFPGFLLLGAVVALVYRWLHGLARALFSDEVASARDNIEAHGVRAVGRGAVGGLVGGLVFTVVMLRLDILPMIAALVGSESLLTGFLVHLVIANLIGISYGFLFRGQSFDFGAALGWGLSYGFFWWLLGPLTLMPILLGGIPQWSVAAAADAFGSLVGHLAYGAALGVTFYWLEARYSPWWVSRTETEVRRIAHRRQQMLTSSPALWVQIVVLALTIPVLLGR